STAIAQDPNFGRSAPGSRGGRPTTDPTEALAAVEKSIQAIGEAALKEPPKRDFKVEQGPLKKIKLRSVDPKFIANKFVADFRHAGRSQVDITHDPRHIERRSKSELTNVQRLVLFDSGNRLARGPASDRGGFDTFPPVGSDIFK